MKNIFIKIKTGFLINNKLLLLLWIMATASFIKKILVLYIVIHALALIKLLFVIIFKKKLNNQKLLDSVAIKGILFWNRGKSKTEKLDILLLIFTAYLIILLSNYSLRSISLAIDFYIILKYTIIFENKTLTFYNLIKKKYYEEFFIVNFNFNEISFLNVKIKISHSNNT